MTKIPHKLFLTEDQMPQQWFNLRAVMQEQPDPMLHPGTLQPVTEADLAPIFCEELARQELDETHEFIDIPEQVLDIYKMYRPSSLIRAYDLEKALGTPAKIYYKYEGNNTSGSHKLNSAVPQAYYAKMQGLSGVTTETGAGQWGTALSVACAYFNLSCDVYMVKCSYEQKPFRKAMMHVFGADVVPSPSTLTQVGRKILAENPDTTGSLGCAISEAVEAATTGSSKRYVLGSVLNQVLLHQSIIGLESKLAMEMLGEYPDIVVGCAGGGSNLGGLIAPFVADFCDTGRVTPLARMYTLGSGFIPAPNHAGGLRYHGMSPILSKLYHDGYMEAVAYEQSKVFEAAVFFAKHETILPAPESSHAIKGAIDEALKCKETGEAKTILFGLTGTGFFDMTAYENYLSGKMTDYVPTDADLQKGFDSLPDIPQNKGI